MQTIDTSLLHLPSSDALRFLPEGPQPCGADALSWVAIQHGADEPVGSLNVLNLRDRVNRSTALEGRPGFAFPADDGDTFLLGLERRIRRFRLSTGDYEELSEEVDSDVSGTIINDGVAFEDGVVFGCKDLKFQEKKAGLYLWREDRPLVQLRDDQICSNGKVIRREGDRWRLFDIDSPTKKVVSYLLDARAGELSEPETVLDLTDLSMFPDGMVETPDGRGLIIAFYNPEDAEYGEARQYNVESGGLECVWRTPDSPQVTCPQLITHENRVWLVLTTAVEHMTAERRARYPQAGGLFIGDTPF